MKLGYKISKLLLQNLAIRMEFGFMDWGQNKPLFDSIQR